jgi:gliding motility-associated-like protein
MMPYIYRQIYNSFYIRMKKTKIIGLSILLFGISTITTAQNQAPVLNTGSTIRQAYCPETEIIIAPDFTITNEDDLGVDSFSIQISSGYSSNSDLLELDLQDHPNIKKDWSSVEGKLKLTPKGGTQILYTDIQKAVRAVVFKSSSSNMSGEKYFSFTIGSANYLPSTSHFYVFESDLDITWTNAKTKAEGKTYYGLQGYLATILSLEENQIAAKQITGTGWIGASDEAAEGVWNWVTGPEAGTNFWNGGVAGSATINPATGIPMYSNWFGGAEPNNSGNIEHYAHIKKNASTWNDLKNAGDGPLSADYRAEGYIIEYGGMPGDPVLQISASTSIYVPKIVTISADIEVCAGTSVNLAATVTEGNVLWYDALLGGSLISTGDTFTTPVLNSSKTYYATASPIGCATSDRKAVVITVYTLPIANDPQDIIVCDDNGDGLNSFDFDTDISSQILNGQSTTDFEILYFNNQIDAEANIPDTNLPNPHNVNAGSSQTIFARIHNKNENTCFDVVDFNITVTRLPVPETPSDYAFCDNISVGSDTDGFVNDFILESKDVEILGTLDPNQYNVSYHTSKNGAQTNASLDVIDKTSNYKNTTVNAQPIYVRLENVDNTACFDASKAFNIIVNKLPIVANFAKLMQCDDDLDRVSTVNLTEAEISVSTNYLNETFTYFETQADAILGTPQVIDKLRYPVNRTATAWVRTISSENCYRISKINLEVEAAADVDYYKNFPSVCDDFLQEDGTDGTLNSDTDGITNFDFSQANTDILVFFPPALQPDLEISFFETKEDRTAVINAIADISNYRNIGYPSNVTKQTIYFKITNKNNNNCNGSGELYLKTDPVPIANQPADIELCDSTNDGDGSNGIAQSFDLESQTPIILGTQNSADYKVTYHLSKTDANSGNNPQSSLFTNTIRDLQTIYVRVTDNKTSCFTDHNSFNVIVNPIPIANFVTDIEICDDNSDGSARNGFSQSINLQGQTDEILGTQDPTIYSVTYHHSLLEAQNGSNVLSTPYSNAIPYKETIYIRIYNSLTMCVNDISNFQVIVNPEPTFTTVSNLSYCDNDLDGDDANGIIQNIDLESQIPILLGATQDPDDYIVTFHISQADADSGNLPITSPYTNTTPTETIFVRIQNKATLCINDEATFDIIVNYLPNFMVTSPQILCLNDTPKNISIENPEAIYNYVWKDASGNEISTEDNLNITTGGSYTVTATTTDGTNCSSTETIAITESNPAILLANFITIVDQGNTIGSEDNLSIVIDVINNDLGPGDYQFALRNDDQNTTTSYQDEPLFENLEGAIYTLIVNDKNGCVPDATLQVSVLQFPKFFTPNGDGKNDTYLVKGANKTFYPNSSINIFNRYGKLVAQIPIDGPGWDGTYYGKKLSSDDYWYNITLIPADNNKQIINKTGHFSLLRK